MQLPLSLILLVSVFSAASARPAPHRASPRDVNISHKSLATGTTTTHSIDAALLPAELAEAINGSDININLTTDRVKRATGINNSTINLTVVGSRKRSPLPAPPAAQHHNIHIDASSSGAGGLGGIHNSTVNINLNSSGAKAKAKARRQTRRKVALGDHSVLVDVSSAGASSSDAATGIEDSTVHVNILPPRALAKSTGHHSIVIDSSSLGADEAAKSSTKTGDHSAVVDTSSSSSSTSSDDSTSSAPSSSSGVKNSTINLTVISPKDEPAAPAPVDTVESPIPSLARLSRRSTASFAAWSDNIQRKDLGESTEAAEVVDAPAPAAAPEASGFVVVRRNHHSKPAVLAKRA
ncbi:hypothetical protein JCM6882_008276 [Rhodosporidiobolus microsporus]